MRKIDDFGQKIGGAKKDIFAMLLEMTEDEQHRNAKKDVLWKRPDYKKLEESGIPRIVLFWRNEMRKALAPRPEKGYASQYIQFCKYFSEDVGQCTCETDIDRFYDTKIYFYLKKEGNMWSYAKPEYKTFFNGNKILKYKSEYKRQYEFNHSHFMTSQKELEEKKYHIICFTLDNMEVVKEKDNRYRHRINDGNVYTFWDTVDLSRLEEGCLVTKNHQKECICKTKAEAENYIRNRIEQTKTSKQMFLPPHLTDIRRTGSSYQTYRFTDGNVLLSVYGLRGGEFGNYTTAKDRIGSINMAYDAFEDLHKVLGISAKDISLGGNLSIAFGARGRGGSALAHYEIDRNVINITRFRGAGSLAHEWGHALDVYIGKKYGGSFVTDRENPPTFVEDLVHSFNYQNGKKTNFLKNSEYFDKKCKKSGNGYWASNREMFARAFACYVKDKLGDRRSDYLVGHADCANIDGLAAYPTGEERKMINEKFDGFFKELSKMEFFSTDKPKKEEIKTTEKVQIFAGQNGQMRFF